MPTSVLLVGCSEVAWLGLRKLAEGTDLMVEMNAPNPKSALRLLTQSQFDVVMIDAHLPGDGPIPLIESIRKIVTNQALVLLALQENAAVLAHAASLGLLGLVLYSDSSPDIVQRIMHAAEGRSAWTRDELRRLALSAGTIVPGDGYPVPLTHRETEILTRLIRGGTNKEIAVGLGISYETVKELIQKILSKVGVNDRSQAAVWAVHKHYV